MNESGKERDRETRVRERAREGGRESESKHHNTHFPNCTHINRRLPTRLIQVPLEEEEEQQTVPPCPPPPASPPSWHGGSTITPRGVGWLPLPYVSLRCRRKHTPNGTVIQFNTRSTGFLNPSHMNYFFRRNPVSKKGYLDLYGEQDAQWHRKYVVSMGLTPLIAPSML